MTITKNRVRATATDGDPSRPDCSRWLVRVLLAFLGGLTGVRPGSVELSEEERSRIRMSLWRIRRDLETLAATGFFDDLGDMLRDQREGGGDALRAWFDLIEEVAQAVEQFHGRRSGRGALKKREVKGTLLYFLFKSRVDLPRIPGFIEPFVLEMAVDLAIDATVEVLNWNELWTDAPPQRPLGATVRATVVNRPFALIYWMARLLTVAAWRVIFWLHPAPPRARLVVDRFLERDQTLARRLRLFVEFAVRHARDLIPLTDIVSSAVIEAEHFLVSDGPRKKAYAREVVLAFLEDSAGLPDRDSPRFQVVQWLVDAGIEIVVQLLNKRKWKAGAPERGAAAV